MAHKRENDGRRLRGNEYGRVAFSTDRVHTMYVAHRLLIGRTDMTPGLTKIADDVKS